MSWCLQGLCHSSTADKHLQHHDTLVQILLIFQVFQVNPEFPVRTTYHVSLSQSVPSSLVIFVSQSWPPSPATDVRSQPCPEKKKTHRVFLGHSSGFQFEFSSLSAWLENSTTATKQWVSNPKNKHSLASSQWQKELRRHAHQVVVVS